MPFYASPYYGLVLPVLCHNSEALDALAHAFFVRPFYSKLNSNLTITL